MREANLEVFFYGLFMDEKILHNKGINPINPRKGILKNYGLRIGQRATLLPFPGEHSFGIVMQLSSDELENLYSDPTVSDYIAEKVNIVMENNDSIEALCYNLPEEMVAGSNTQYAHSLLRLAKSLNFPSDYLMHIEGIANSN